MYSTGEKKIFLTLSLQENYIPPHIEKMIRPLNTPTQEERLSDVIAYLKSDQLPSNHRIARLL